MCHVTLLPKNIHSAHTHTHTLYTLSIHSLDSTSHSDYQSLPGNQRPPPLHKHITLAKVYGIG